MHERGRELNITRRFAQMQFVPKPDEQKWKKKEPRVIWKRRVSLGRCR